MSTYIYLLYIPSTRNSVTEPRTSTNTVWNGPIIWNPNPTLIPLWTETKFENIYDIKYSHFFLNNSYLKFIYFLKKIIFFYDRVNLLSVYITAQILLSIWLNQSGYFTNFQKKLFVYLGALRWSRQSSVSSKN